MMQARVLISGMVHGVGFRYFVKQKADELGLTGWVCNTHDGNVEAVFQSSASFHSDDTSSSVHPETVHRERERADQEGQKQIDKAIAACKEGPPMAQVKNVEVVEEKSKEVFESFEII